MNHIEQLLRMELIEKSFEDRRKAAADAGIDLDPDDPTKPMSILNFDPEKGTPIRRSAEEALKIFKKAQRVKAAYRERADKRVSKKLRSLKDFEKDIKGKKDPENKIQLELERRKSALVRAKENQAKARSIPDPDIEQFKPKLPTIDLAKSVARRAVYTGAAAIGTQLLGKVGDRMVRDFGIGVPAGGDAEAQERARQGAATLGPFLKQAAFGDRESKAADSNLKKFGLFGAGALGAADKLRSTSARQRDLNILAGKSRKRDIFTAARQRLGRTPFSNREAQLLGAIEKKTS